VPPNVSPTPSLIVEIKEIVDLSNAANLNAGISDSPQGKFKRVV